jgi:membrane-associated phospholipid phosphatase
MRPVRTPRGSTGPAERAWARVSKAEAALLVAVAVALAAAWAVAVHRDEVPAFEASVFHAVNGLPGWLGPLLWPVMQLGSVGVALAVPVLVALVSRDWRLTAAVLLSGQSAFWAAKLVKGLVGRDRPAGLLPDAIVREAADGHGFASGHAAVAFAVATVLAPLLPRPARVLAVLAAATVGVGRVYYGVHLPLDVVGGAGIGIMLGTLFSWVLVRPHRPAAFATPLAGYPRRPDPDTTREPP